MVDDSVKNTCGRYPAFRFKPYDGAKECLKDVENCFIIDALLELEDTEEDNLEATQTPPAQDEVEYKFRLPVERRKALKYKILLPTDGADKGWAEGDGRGHHFRTLHLNSGPKAGSESQDR